jgi:heparanase
MTRIFKTLLTLSGMFALWGFDSTRNERTRIVLDLDQLELIGEVDERYQSVNVEMCEVVGGDFWIPYHLIDTARVKKEGLAALKRKIPN